MRRGNTHTPQKHKPVSLLVQQHRLHTQEQPSLGCHVSCFWFSCQQWFPSFQPAWIGSVLGWLRFESRPVRLWLQFLAKGDTLVADPVALPPKPVILCVTLIGQPTYVPGITEWVSRSRLVNVGWQVCGTCLQAYCRRQSSGILPLVFSGFSRLWQGRPCRLVFLCSFAPAYAY